MINFRAWLVFKASLTFSELGIAELKSAIPRYCDRGSPKIDRGQKFRFLNFAIGKFENMIFFIVVSNYNSNIFFYIHFLVLTSLPGNSRVCVCRCVGSVCPRVALTHYKHRSSWLETAALCQDKKS